VFVSKAGRTRNPNDFSARKRTRQGGNHGAHRGAETGLRRDCLKSILPERQKQILSKTFSLEQEGRLSSVSLYSSNIKPFFHPDSSGMKKRLLLFYLCAFVTSVVNISVSFLVFSAISKV